MGKLIKNTGGKRRKVTFAEQTRARKAPKNRCTSCHGAGRLACEFCRGQGETRTGSDLHGDAITATCPACFGSRLARCHKCKGIGLTL